MIVCFERISAAAYDALQSGMTRLSGHDRSHELPLQDADILETENYWLAAQWLKLGNVQAIERNHYRAFAG